MGRNNKKKDIITYKIWNLNTNSLRLNSCKLIYAKRKIDLQD